MKLWIGGEISAEVADSFRRARSSVERAINEAIGTKEYSIGVASWDCIAILRDDNAMKEIIKYSAKKREMDFRLRIDLQKFQTGSDLQREALIFEMLERSLALLKEKGAPREGLDLLAADLKPLCFEKGWMAI